MGTLLQQTCILQGELAADFLFAVYVVWGSSCFSRQRMRNGLNTLTSNEVKQFWVLAVQENSWKFQLFKIYVKTIYIPKSIDIFSLLSELSLLAFN